MDTKSSAITATAFGFLFLRKYAITELSNPPDSEIRFDFDELHDPMEDKRIAQNRARTELRETDPDFLPMDADE